MGRTRTTFRNTTAARHAFRRAGLPTDGQLDGTWVVEWLGGEAWEQARGWRDRLLGIRGSWALRFDGSVVHHVLGKPRKRVEAQPLVLDVGTSTFDGQPAVTCSPTPDLGAAWIAVHYELRALDADTILGLDVNGPGRWSVPMPFVLHRHED